MAFGETFVTLCLQTMVKEDYGNKQKRKQHNSAVDALRKLSLSLRREEAAAQLEPLLSHKDSRVRVFAASACGEWDVLTNKAAAALRDVIVSEQDTTLKMNAAMVLKQYMEDSFINKI